MIKQSALVSVIIPIYNVGQYLNRCVQSIVDQTYQALEIILINDGSTDDSLMKCVEWSESDNRIRVIDRPCGGAGPARTHGINIAQGVYILFVDSDDWIVPECVEILISAAIAQDADMVIYDYYLSVLSQESSEFTYQSGRRCFDLGGRAVRLEEHPEMLSRCSGVVWNKFQKTEFVKKYVYEQPARPYEDVGYVYHMLLHASRIVQVKRALYYYWINRKSSTTNGGHNIESCGKALIEMKKVLEGNINFDTYKLQLEKYAAAYYSISLKRLSKEQKSEYTYAISYYYSLFPKAKLVDELKFVVMGSLSSSIVFERMRLLQLQPYRSLGSCSPIYSDWPVIERKLESVEIGSCDYVLLDLLEDDFKRRNHRPEWRKVLEKFVKYLLLHCKQSHIFLLDSRWGLGEGLYGIEYKYPDLQERQIENEILEEAIYFLKHQLPGAIVIRKPKDKDCFSDKDFMLPLNNYWYYDAADQLREELERNIDGQCNRPSI